MKYINCVLARHLLELILLKILIYFCAKFLYFHWFYRWILSTKNIPKIAFYVTSHVRVRNMNLILVVFILWMLAVNGCLCSILVVNKLNRKTHIIQHDLLLSGLEQPLIKVQLYFVQLSKTCSIPKIPQSKLYSLHPTKVKRETVLVIPVDGDGCEISEIISLARKSGHSGIVFRADTIERFRRITPIEGFYTSVILNNNGVEISKYDATRHKISIFRDTSKLEDFLDHLRRLFEWTNAASRLVVTMIQILLVLTPIFVLLAAYFLTSHRQYYEPFQSHQSYHWDNEDSSEDSTESISFAKNKEFRKILNVGDNAGRKEIERAFRDRAFVLHPGMLALKTLSKKGLIGRRKNLLDKNLHLDEGERLRREEELKKCYTAKEILLAALLNKSKSEKLS